MTIPAKSLYLKFQHVITRSAQSLKIGPNGRAALIHVGAVLERKLEGVLRHKMMVGDQEVYLTTILARAH